MRKMKQNKSFFGGKDALKKQKNKTERKNGQRRNKTKKRCVWIGLICGGLLLLLFGGGRYTSLEDWKWQKWYGYEKEETAFFCFYSKGEKKETLNGIQKQCERVKQALDGFFSCEEKKKIPILFFREEKEMDRVMGLKQGTRAMGVYVRGKIGILLPDSFTKENKKEFYTTLLHEMSHCYLERACPKKCPSWFQEGLALYLEESLAGNIWEGTVSGKGEQWDFTSWKSSFSDRDKESSYTLAYRLMKGMETRFGSCFIKDLTEKIKEGNDVETAFYRLTGKKLVSFYRETIKRRV